MAELTCRGLALGYEGKNIIEDLSFTVETGNYLCIVGENGAGKSTLVRTLLGLRSPNAGTITFGDGLVRREIGYLPQQTPVQRDFPASVREIVLSGRQGRTESRFFYTKADKAAAKEVMEQLGIQDLAVKSYRELSGGQQQRVLLARALCATRRLLVLDEPAAGLDPRITQEMYDLIEDLHKQGITIIMITHDMDAALRYADHILHIGDTLFFGTTEEYRRSRIGRRFIGVTEDEEDAGEEAPAEGEIPAEEETLAVEEAPASEEVPAEGGEDA